MSQSPPISFVLASSSPYKKNVLAKLGLPFATQTPDINESPLPNETPNELVARLATEKAQKVLASYQYSVSAGEPPRHLFIGVDQVAVLEGEILTKPGNFQNAVTQLTACSGQEVKFLTGISLVDQNNQHMSLVEPFSVVFKKLNSRQIHNYVRAEQPFDCAGSFKCEGMGILLFESMCGRDINSLIGMPLLALQELAQQFNIDLFDLLTPTN